MKKNKKFLIFWMYLTLLVFIGTNCRIFAKNLNKYNVLSSARGSLISYESSSYSETVTAKRLIDEKDNRGWRSKKNSTFPHIIIFKLAGVAKINLLKFNNNTYETMYPGISSKEVQVEFSTISPDMGYINAGTFILEKNKEIQEFKIQKNKAQWIRLTIFSNHGNPSFTELMEFEAWGVFDITLFQMISFFIAILGGALILATFSYHEFLTDVKQARRIKFIKKNSFKIPFFFGLILMASGLSLYIFQPFLSSMLGLLSFILIILLLKLIKIQTKVKQKN